MNHRIRSELLQIDPLDAVEAAHRDGALAWLDSGAPIFRVTKPATPPKHLVVYFAVIDEGHILLVDHRNAQLWLPAGGHVEVDEHPRATVVRELREELGIVIPVAAVAAPTMVTVTDTVGLTAGHTDVTLWYVVAGDRSVTVEFDRDEFVDVRWFPFEATPAHRCEPHLARLLEKVGHGRSAGNSASDGRGRHRE